MVGGVLWGCGWGKRMRGASGLGPWVGWLTGRILGITKRQRPCPYRSFIAVGCERNSVHQRLGRQQSAQRSGQTLVRLRHGSGTIDKTRYSLQADAVATGRIPQ